MFLLCNELFAVLDVKVTLNHLHYVATSEVVYGGIAHCGIVCVNAFDAANSAVKVHRDALACAVINFDEGTRFATSVDLVERKKPT